MERECDLKKGRGIAKDDGNHQRQINSIIIQREQKINIFKSVLTSMLN